MVVRLDAGRDAVRAYVEEHASQGKEHVLELLRADRDAVLALIDDLSEDEARVPPAPNEWSIFETMQHVDASFARSNLRIATMASGRPFENPQVTPGTVPEQAAPSFAELRSTFRDGTNEVIATVEGADPTVGLDLTADHSLFGSFNWLQWAVYSHHVHTHDHIGQIGEARAALGK